MKTFASKIIGSNVSSDLKLQSCPKRTKLSFRLTNKPFAHALFTIVCNCSQNPFTYSHLKKICSIASPSFSQTEQVTSFSTPMCANTAFVAKICCTSLIWKPFKFYFLDFLYFFKASIWVNVSAWSPTSHNILVYYHPVLAPHSKGVHPFVHCK